MQGHLLECPAVRLGQGYQEDEVTQGRSCNEDGIGRRQKSRTVDGVGDLRGQEGGTLV